MNVTIHRECQDISSEFKNIFEENQACVVRIDDHYGLIDHDQKTNECLIEFVNVKKLHQGGFVFAKYGSNTMCLAESRPGNTFVWSPEFVSYRELEGYLIVYTSDKKGHFLDLCGDTFDFEEWDDIVGDEYESDVFELSDDEYVIVRKDFTISDRVYLECEIIDANLSTNIPYIRVMRKKDLQTAIVNIRNFRQFCFSPEENYSIDTIYSAETDKENVIAQNYLMITNGIGEQGILRLSDMKISPWLSKILVLSEENDFACCQAKDKSHIYFLRLSDFTELYFNE